MHEREIKGGETKEETVKAEEDEGTGRGSLGAPLLEVWCGGPKRFFVAGRRTLPSWSQDADLVSKANPGSLGGQGWAKTSGPVPV